MTTEYIVPCKINLGLEILAKRTDGYHELNTVFYRVLEPHDLITVRESENFQFTCSDPSLATSENLGMKAAAAWQKYLGCDLPNIHVHLDKRIPMGAGLGGGSSDAATMLQILNEHQTISESALARIAASIGADVPFFLSNAKAAIASGIGEELTPFDLDLSMTILIVFDPTIQVSTREAYAGVAMNPVATNYNELLKDTEDVRDLKDYLRNDFEPTIFVKHPKLAAIKQSLYDRGASVALMSGSGSALFGLFEDVDVANEAKRQFDAEDLKAFLS